MTDTTKFVKLRNMKEFYDIEKVYYFCWETSTYKIIKKWSRCDSQLYYHNAIIVELFNGTEMFYIDDLYYKKD